MKPLKLQATPPTKIMVQLYDKERVREYVKANKGLMFSSEEIVRADRLNSELILEIQTTKQPTKIILNGKIIPYEK